MPTHPSVRDHSHGGTPYLTPAVHLTPEDGTCLMEAVSAAAGLPWSDNPACTHPLLAHLGRLVNDASSDGARQRLAELIPALAAASPGDPDDSARAAARLAVSCTDEGLRTRPTPLLACLNHVATTRLRWEETPGEKGRWAAAVRRRAFLHGAGARAVEHAVLACTHLPAGVRDEALLGLLRTGYAAVTQDRGGPAAPDTGPGG